MEANGRPLDWREDQQMAVNLANGLFKLLPTKDYDPEDEHWEFLPASIVRAKEVLGTDGVYLLAVASPQP